MDSYKAAELDYEFLPYLRAYKDGHIERLVGTETVLPSFDPQTNVTSKDVLIIPEENLSARLYLPNVSNTHQKLPLLVYYHGGSFCLGSSSGPMYHNFLNSLVSKANVVAVSVDYRLAPEHPLPAAYNDSWASLKWVTSHAIGQGSEPWVKKFANFDKLFLAGDSSGGNIAHNMAMLAGNPKFSLGTSIVGIALIHPYFWGSKSIGSEATYRTKKFADRVWPFLCPSAPSNDDPRVNPVGDGAPSLSGLGCQRVLIFIAGKDLLRFRGWLYYETLSKRGWKGVAEIAETKGEDHGFHLHHPAKEQALRIIASLADFLNVGNSLSLL